MTLSTQLLFHQTFEYRVFPYTSVFRQPVPGSRVMMQTTSNLCAKNGSWKQPGRHATSSMLDRTCGTCSSPWCILDLILLPRIRLGTFNVNDKMPNQDLSSWVRGDQDASLQKEFIPPLKEISPLSIGDCVKGLCFDRKW